jgi:NAD(P)-dependent dehydrogenase (short-subunit alcohol dehydrogenase family)
VNLLVNNAGLFTGNRLVRTGDPDAARREMEVNYFGVLNMTRAFAPVLGANSGGYIANVLSVAGAFPAPFMGGYSPAKAAALFLSSITRSELAEQGTEVIALIVGSADTRMAAHVRGCKEDPRDIARAGLTALDRDVGRPYRHRAPDPNTGRRRPGLQQPDRPFRARPRRPHRDRRHRRARHRPRQ